jgi:hypothetical protein
MSKLYDMYLDLKKEDADTLYLFKCGKFYIFIAEDCIKINDYVVLKKVPFTKDKLKCGFPKESLNDYMRVFNNHNLKIKIIEDKNNKIMEEKNNEVLDELKKININYLTPIEALSILKTLQDKVI